MRDEQGLRQLCCGWAQKILYKDDTPDCGGWAGKDDATKIVGSSALGGAHAMGQLPWTVAKVLSQPAELGLRQAGRDAPRERAVVVENADV